LADILASTEKTLRVKELGFEFRQRHAGESKLDAKVALDFLGFLVNKLTRGAVPVSFTGFMLVGCIGVVVHLAILRLGLAGGGVAICKGDSGGPVFSDGLFGLTLTGVIYGKEGGDGRQCGATAQAVRIAPQRAWIDRVMAQWGN
jgi:hypothetical protein